MRLACVIFFDWVKVSRINTKNHPFCVIRQIQAGLILGFHKITEVRMYLSAKTDNLFKIDE